MTPTTLISLSDFSRGYKHREGEKLDSSCYKT